MNVGPSTSTGNDKKAADDWADRGMNGEHFLWETNKEVEDRNIVRICGFWDGNYREGRCGVETETEGKIVNCADGVCLFLIQVHLHWTLKRSQTLELV